MVGRKWAVAAMAVAWFASAATAASAGGKAKGRCVSELSRAGLTSGDVNPGKANFIVGTQGDDAFSPEQFTDGVDVVCGFGGSDEVEFVSQGDIFLGGAGDDRVPGDYRTSGLSGTFVGGEGDDFVMHLRAGTFDGGPGDDSVGFLHGGGTFNGGAGNDNAFSLNGGTFNGGAGNDSVTRLRHGTFNGGAGNDSVSMLEGGTFNGGAGDDTVRGVRDGTFNQD